MVKKVQRLFTNTTIRDGVMKVVEARIEAAQKELNEGVKKLDADCKVAIAAAEQKCKDDKQTLATTLINGIVGKIL